MVSKKLDPVDLVVTRVDRPGARLCYTSAHRRRRPRPGAEPQAHIGDEENWSVTAVAQRMWHGAPQTLDAAGRAPQAAPALFLDALCARASPLKDTIGGRAVASGVAYTPWAAPGWSMRWEDEPVGSLKREACDF